MGNFPAFPHHAMGWSSVYSVLGMHLHALLVLQYTKSLLYCVPSTHHLLHLIHAWMFVHPLSDLAHASLRKVWLLEWLGKYFTFIFFSSFWVVVKRKRINLK